MPKNPLLVVLMVWFSLFLSACGSETLNETEPSTETIGTEELEEAILEEIEKEVLEKESSSDSTKEVESDKGDTDATSGLAVDSNLRVHYIDVGQADSTLYEYSHEGDDYRVLIDAGDWSGKEVTTYLDSIGITEIDVMVGTHVHADHIGQMSDVLEKYEVSEVWMTGNTATTNVYTDTLDKIEDSNARYHEPRGGDVYDIGPLVVEVLHPNVLTDDANRNSISLRLTYGEVSFIHTGDAEEVEELSMVRSQQELKADVLQVGHHGSNTSTVPEFLKTVDPSTAIISAGEDNSYGHPHKDVVERLLGAGVDLYGTHKNGTVIIETDGKTYSVKTENGGHLDSFASASSGEAETKEEVKTKSEPEEVSVSVAPANCININSASVEELQGVVHLGIERAQQVVQLRPFQSVKDLTRVKGIAEGRMNDILAENKACVGG